ncbi:MAG: DNA-protecting protein DprA [Bdellovibrionaceae bacterium]|nr:DNA-protecting protein DprA [Pseudobdellovibrionaceae bacterium]
MPVDDLSSCPAELAFSGSGESASGPIMGEPRYDYLLLSFLSRSRFHVTAVEWDLLTGWLTFCPPRMPAEQFWREVRLLLPKSSWVERLGTLGAKEWQKKRDELKFMEEQGVQYLLPNQYAKAFLGLQDRPRALCLLGSASIFSAPQNLAVVGAREADPKMLSWLDTQLLQFYKVFPQALVISGGARGVDQQAHMTALRTGKPTLIWLPSGIKALYPQSWTSYTALVLELGGAFASEYHPKETIRPHYFHQRNRLIVGMADLCLIPQMRCRSGSSLSARLAAESGVPLAVVAAAPWDYRFDGNTEFIRQGAFMCLGAEDLVDFFRNKMALNSQEEKKSDVPVPVTSGHP